MELVVTRRDRQLNSLVGLVLAGCVVYFAYSRGSVFQDIPEIIVPLGISVGLLAISLRVRQQGLVSDQLERIVTFGWVGAIASTVTSGWWAAIELNRGSALVDLSNEILTVWSSGIGASVLLGACAAASYDHDRPAVRDHVLAEEVWTGRREPDPIVSVIVEAIANREGVGPLELEPLYDDIDPDIFATLREKENAQWQLRFYTDEYEVRVSSQGVVTILDSVVTTRDEVVISVS